VRAGVLGAEVLGIRDDAVRNRVHRAPLDFPNTTSTTLTKIVKNCKDCKDCRRLVSKGNEEACFKARIRGIRINITVSGCSLILSWACRDTVPCKKNDKGTVRPRRGLIG
jgi:hypothetical protein